MVEVKIQGTDNQKDGGEDERLNSDQCKDTNDAKGSCSFEEEK